MIITPSPVGCNAAKPELFSEIDARFAGGKASDAAIRSYLLTQKFTPPAADAVVRSYRETKSLAAMESSSVESTPTTKDVEKPTMNTSSVTSTMTLSPPMGGWLASPMDDPYEVAISGNSKTGKKIEGRFSFRDQQSVDDLISVLTAMKAQLPKADQTATDNDAAYSDSLEQ